ncbi:extracellular solute-binding protein [Paenibacillus sp. F411]|uniref:extracellular solute-binding protein n=1 Tax=Paenibacillus sp. F411 TaxID=2820239 RepID=UPI001AAF52A2|nr:extracellular solute-binding protein [Paenibacillus sp. F411]MBO2943538.1 extracellular solute-binding protein [Paenibacillus sp. F411]
MKKAWKSSMTLLLTGAVLLTGCTGGSGTTASDPPADSGNNKPSEGSSSSAYVLGQNPLEFSFYGNYDWYTMPTWGADDSSKWVKENMKVNITPIHSGGNASQKLNTMIASASLPDVMWMERGPDVEKLRQAGMLVPFDDYLDKYPNLKEWLGESGLNLLRSEDGKLYQFPNWYTSQPNGNAGYVVNKKIYEELGSPKLETTEDLYNYLKQVKENYPNVVPFEPHLAKDGQGLNVLYTAFGENVLNTWVGIRGVPNGDQLTSIFTDPIYRESMQYSAKLFREKLMSQDAMTQTADQVKEKVVSGRVAVLASASPTELGQLGHIELTKSDPDAGYFMIWPIHKPGLDPKKVLAGTYTQLGWNVSVITKAAKDPEAIFAFLDWYTGPEGQRTMMWGPEGGYWDGVEADQTPKFTDKYVTDAEGLVKLQNATINLIWNGNTVYVDQAKAKYESTLPIEQRNWATHWQYEITWKTQGDGTPFINLDPMPDSEEGIIRQRVEDIFLESRAKALYAKDDAEVNAVLDKAEADAQSAGYNKLLEYKTKKWQENIQKMQGK